MSISLLPSIVDTSNSDSQFNTFIIEDPSHQVVDLTRRDYSSAVGAICEGSSDGKKIPPIPMNEYCRG